MSNDSQSSKQVRRSTRHKTRHSRSHLKLDFSQRPRTANSTSGNFSISPTEHDGTQSDPEDLGEKHIMRRDEQNNQAIKVDNDAANDLSPCTIPNGQGRTSWRKESKESNHGQSNHSPRKSSRHSSYGSDRRHKRPRIHKKRASSARQGSGMRLNSSMSGQRAPGSFDAGANRNTPTIESEQAIMESLERAYNFAVHPNTSLKADSLILFKANAQPTERLHALITAMHAELFLAMSFIDREPAPFDFVDPVTNRWKELVMQDLLVEIMPRVGGFLQQLGFEVGMAFDKHRAGVRTSAHSHQAEAGGEGSRRGLDRT